MNGDLRSLPQSDGKPQSATEFFGRAADGIGLLNREEAPRPHNSRQGVRSRDATATDPSGSDALNGAVDRVEEQLLIGCRIQLASVGAGGDILG